MGDAKENMEVIQGVPSVVGENEQLVDAQVRYQPEAASDSIQVEEISNHLENGKGEPPSEAKSELPAENKTVKPVATSQGGPEQDVQNSETVSVEGDAQITNRTEYGEASDPKEAEGFPLSSKDAENNGNVCQNNVDIAETPAVVSPEAGEVANSKTCDRVAPIPSGLNETAMPQAGPAIKKVKINNVLEAENKADEKQAATPADNGTSNSNHMFFLDADHYDGNESGTEEEQSAFMKELENFFRERSMEFKPPKFYGEGLNCLKLWRAVTRLGGYDKVTSCKLWRQVGESFKPPKTCTTVSWTFRGFYEKALLDYERHKMPVDEVCAAVTPQPEPMNIDNQASASSGRARRDAAARAMQGWHSQRLLSNGEVSDPIIKDRNSVSMQKREKQIKSTNTQKRKAPSLMDNAVKAARSKPSKAQLDITVVDIGPPADWVKINVQKTKDCFEVFALVPGLLREEVRVQTDPAGRVIISGEPEYPDNPWGVTPFKKILSLPGRVDPYQTTAVVTLHGQLHVSLPFQQSE